METAFKGFYIKYCIISTVYLKKKSIIFALKDFSKNS